MDVKCPDFFPIPFLGKVDVECLFFSLLFLGKVDVKCPFFSLSFLGNVDVKCLDFFPYRFSGKWMSSVRFPLSLLGKVDVELIFRFRIQARGAPRRPGSV